jgi:hypothetical protein
MSLTSISVAQEHTTKRTMSHEEDVVRTTYADLSSAAQVGVLWHAIDRREGQSDLRDRLAVSEAMDKQLRFELADFEVGELRRAGRASSILLVRGPVGILSAQYHEVPVNHASGELNENLKLVYADIAWKVLAELQKGPARPMPAHKVSNVKQFVRALRQPKSGGEWTRFASYSVVARLRDRSVSYRATFLFSGRGATEEILPLDYATAMNIAPFIKLQMCPPAVASTVFHEIPDVQAWALEHQACRCAKAHEKVASSHHVTGRPPANKPASTGASDHVSAPEQYGISQCKKTVAKLPTECLAAETVFSVAARTVVNTTISDSQTNFACGWICSRSDSSNGWHIHHGPWQLDTIGESRIENDSNTMRRHRCQPFSWMRS